MAFMGLYEMRRWSVLWNDWHFALQKVEISQIFAEIFAYLKKNSIFAAESCKDNKNEHKIMARPIKETPTLYGEDARRFAYAVEHPRKVTAAEMQRMEESYQKVKSIANFAF